MLSLEGIYNAEESFRDSVRDDFGRSILEDVFSPIIHELCALEQLQEKIRMETNEINRRMEEARAIISG